MATISSFTAARSQQIEDATIESAYVDLSGHLKLVRHDATVIDAGSVVDPETGSRLTSLEAAVLAAQNDIAAVDAKLTWDGMLKLSGSGAFGSVAGTTIDRAGIISAMNDGCTGLELDPRYRWDATALDAHGLSRFRIRMGSAASATIGWGGAFDHLSGYIMTDYTSVPTDGIVCYGDEGAESDGLIWENCFIRGSNPGGVMHMGGRQRRFAFPGTTIENTNAVRATVAAASNGQQVTGFTGTGVLTVDGGTTNFASSGNLIVPTSRGCSLLHYTGKTATTFTGVNCKGGTGLLATGGIVGQAAFALKCDTGLIDHNSENNSFGPRLQVIGGNCAIGYSIDDQTEHCNDSRAEDMCAAAGLVAVMDCVGSNITHDDYYGRSNPKFAESANFGGVLTFIGGEARNADATAPHDYVSNSGTTVYDSRTLSIVTAPDTMVIDGGRVEAKKRCRWAGNIKMYGTAWLDVSDPSGSYASASISGASGVVLYSQKYVADNPAPVMTSYTGDKFHIAWTTG